MNCDRARGWLDDPAADEADAGLVGEHLEQCPHCLAYAGPADGATVVLAAEIRPPVDLWQGIQTQMHQRAEQRASVRGAFQGALQDGHPRRSILLAVAAVIFLAFVIESQLSNPEGGEIISLPMDSLAAAMERECRGAMTELNASHTDDGDDPEVAALHVQALEVDRAILDTRRALEEEGSQPRMLTSLAHLCRVRLRLTERAQKLSRS